MCFYEIIILILVFKSKLLEICQHFIWTIYYVSIVYVDFVQLKQIYLL